MTDRTMQELCHALATAEADRQDASVTWPDFREGLASFGEKRPPQFPRMGVD